MAEGMDSRVGGMLFKRHSLTNELSPLSMVVSDKFLTVNKRTVEGTDTNVQLFIIKKIALDLCLE